MRFLLIRGADKEIRDNNGRNPLDLVTNGEVTYQNLAADLKKMLGDPSMLDCLLLTAPSRMVRRNPTTMIVYILMMLVAIALQVLFVFPCKFLISATFLIRLGKNNVIVLLM